jgi:hypothetical protein
MVAASAGHRAVIVLLLEKGANAFLQSADGGTAEFYAADRGFIAESRWDASSRTG